MNSVGVDWLNHKRKTVIGRRCSAKICTARGVYEYRCHCGWLGLLCDKHIEHAKFIKLRCRLGGRCVRCKKCIWRRLSFEDRQAADVSTPENTCLVSACADCVLEAFDKRSSDEWRQSHSRKSTKAETTDKCNQCGNELGQAKLDGNNEDTLQADGRKFCWSRDKVCREAIFCTKCVTKKFKAVVERLAEE